MADAEFHSGTCDGLALERREHVARITSLEKAMQAELTGLPSTLAQALQRMSTTPEAGTTAYAEAVSERARLHSSEAAAAKLNCPADATIKAL